MAGKQERFVQRIIAQCFGDSGVVVDGNVVYMALLGNEYVQAIIFPCANPDEFFIYLTGRRRNSNSKIRTLRNAIHQLFHSRFAALTDHFKILEQTPDYIRICLLPLSDQKLIQS